MDTSFPFQSGILSSPAYSCPGQRHAKPGMRSGAALGGRVVSEVLGEGRQLERVPSLVFGGAVRKQ